MKDFCVSLPPGTSSDAVRTLANEHGYEVSYEALFAPPGRDGGCDDDGGTADAGCVADAGVPQPFVGNALVTDPRFYRPTCALHFDAAGHLSSSTFRNE